MGFNFLIIVAHAALSVATPSANKPFHLLVIRLNNFRQSLNDLQGTWWLQSKCERRGEIRTWTDHSLLSISGATQQYLLLLFVWFCFLYSNKIRPLCLLQIFNMMAFHLLNLQIKRRLEPNCSLPWYGDCHHTESAFLQRVIWMRQSASTRATDRGSVLCGETGG